MIVEQIEVFKPFDSVIIRQVEDGYTSEEHHKIFGSINVEHHNTLWEAKVSIEKKIKRLHDVKELLAPTIKKLLPEMQNLGIEGTIEYCEKNFEKICQMAEEDSK